MDEEAILQLLVRHQEKLLHLLQSEQLGSLQTYRFKGNKVNKTLTLASSAATLLEDYQKAYNLTQRAIVETALADFFRATWLRGTIKTGDNLATQRMGMTSVVLIFQFCPLVSPPNPVPHKEFP